MPYYNERLFCISNIICTRVWSGFVSPDDYEHILDLCLNEESPKNARRLRSSVRTLLDMEIARKKEHELTWPSVTDCDRLIVAFNSLGAKGILGIHNGGFSQSDCHDTAREKLANSKNIRYIGYCFYHLQSVWSVLNSRELHIGFDDVHHGSPNMKEVGKIVSSTLLAHNFKVEWNGEPNTKIALLDFDWKMRSGLEL